MSSILKVNTIQDTDGNNIINENANVITIGASGDTITVPAGATVSGFTSTGIDDNATEAALIISSDERVTIVSGAPTQTSSTLSLKDDAATTTGAKPRLGFQDSANTYLGELGYASGGTSDLYLTNIQNANLIFTTNNTEHMRIDSSGKVSIGDTTSSGYRLKIKGTIANNADDQGILLEEAGTGGAFIKYDGSANLLKLGGYNAGEVDSINIVRNTGDVGVGTTSPASKLHVSSGGNADIQISPGANQCQILMTNAGATDYRIRSDNSPDGLILGTSSIDAMTIDSSGNVGIGTSSPAHNLEIVATASGSINDSLQIRNNTTTTGSGSRLRFITSTDLNSDTNGASIASVRNGNDNDLVFEVENSEAMRIDHAGIVGIGTSSPSSISNLHVADAYASEPMIRIETSDSGNKRLDLYVSSGHGYVTARQSAQNLNLDARSNLIFNSGSSAGTERMRIDGSTGNVGIGTTTPSEKLEVNGNAKFTQTYISSDDETNVFREITQVESSAQGWMVSTGALPIPSPGIYRVTAFCRLRWNVGSNYYKMSLFSSTSNTTNFTEDRMIIEHIEDDSGGFANVGMSADWIIDVPTGNTSGANVYVGFFAQFADSVFRCVNDANGRPYFMATKLRETTTTGTTLAEIRTHN